jgi:hypothetical protein
VEFLVITGLSGAGRSQAGNSLEDLGWFVIDNLPAELIPKVGELAQFQGLVPLQGGQEAAQAPGQHGFAAPWSAAEQQVMAAGSGNLQGPPAVLLAPHIPYIQCRRHGRGGRCWAWQHRSLSPLQQGEGPCKVGGRPYSQPLHQQGFGGVGGGHDQGSSAAVVGMECHSQDAAQGA